MPPARGLIVAAPASGCGKTMLTLALLRAFRKAGTPTVSAKTGPDYIDPAYHAAASGRDCVNLDPWAMRPALLSALARRLAEAGELLLIEGVMGLYDGAADGRGSTADLAERLSLPVLLLIDAGAQAQSAAALVRGFVAHRPSIRIAGVVLNRVGGPRHVELIARALAPVGVPVVGSLPRDATLSRPDRHLGLVQAGEQADLSDFLEAAAATVSAHIDLARIQAIAAPLDMACGDEPADLPPPLPPLGQRIAVARDLAFAFAYPHLLEGWREAGAELAFFSPLEDEAPDPRADAVYLPGGYPELHAGRLAGNHAFLQGLQGAAERGAAVYGECGGYMVLGTGLVDGEDRRHAMAGLLPLETSFAKRRLHLGYRRAGVTEMPLAGAYTGHEFHYATVLREEGAAPLCSLHDAEGHALPAAGLRRGRVAGSFVHLIDRDETADV